jgi:ubiquinone/menaquinone biosynthesis C-methylase UbiE
MDVDDMPAALREAARLLEPGGRQAIAPAALGGKASSAPVDHTVASG